MAGWISGFWLANWANLSKIGYFRRYNLGRYEFVDFQYEFGSYEFGSDEFGQYEFSRYEKSAHPVERGNTAQGGGKYRPPRPTFVEKLLWTSWSS